MRSTPIPLGFRIRLLLTLELSFQIVQEATTLTRLRKQIERIQPNLLVVDWGLVADGPVGVLPMLRRLCPGLRVLALHVHTKVREVALASGADGFVGKGEAPVLGSQAACVVSGSCQTV
jgi:DNA-binding NarL/FixJ family response regulator